MQRRHTHYAGNRQHDAHEFLCECLDALEEEVTAAYTDGRLTAPEPTSASPPKSERMRKFLEKDKKGGKGGSKPERGAVEEVAESIPHVEQQRTEKAIMPAANKEEKKQRKFI